MIGPYIQRLEKLLPLFEAYETTLRPDQIEHAAREVLALQEALQQIKAPSSFLACVMQHPSKLDTQAAVSLMVSRKRACAQADTIRLLLAAYEPYSQSKAITHLKQRRDLVRQLQKLIQTAQEIEATATAQTRRERPYYLQVVRAEGDNSEGPMSKEGGQQ